MPDSNNGNYAHDAGIANTKFTTLYITLYPITYIPYTLIYNLYTIYLNIL